MTEVASQANEPVLVVDDQSTARTILREILQSLGYDVVEAASAEEAIERVRERAFCLVTLDIILPRSSGLEVLRFIRERHAYSELPVIVVSIKDQSDDIVEALSLGANDYVTKPINHEVLAARIRTHLSQWQVERELRRAREDLETRVVARTAELELANRALRTEVDERRKAEKQLEDYRNNLEELVSSRTAELEAANNEIASFSYSVSHDLRGPLRSIDGFSKLMLEDYGDRLDDNARVYLSRIRSASQHMGELIDDVLLLSRLSRRELSFEDLNLARLARDIFRKLDDSEPGRQAELVVPGQVPANGDPHLLRILLENLLGNAWKYSRKQSATRIELGAERDEDGQVIYFVRDNGVGFDMKYVEKLFQPFQRLHSVTEFEGTGIGLATVAQIVRRHGGEVWAESELYSGATFYFTLTSRPTKAA